jgi:amino-acid N-acetyltransferase
MIRKATLADMTAIHHLVREFAARDEMLPMSVGEVTDRLRDFWVCEEKGAVVGTVAVHVTWGLLVELRSLAVRRDRQRRGIGTRLVRAALAEARRLGAEAIFTLTYVPGYFVRFGFRHIDRAELPHKVWLDCVKCPKFPDCGEVAMIRAMEPATRRGRGTRRPR